MLLATLFPAGACWLKTEAEAEAEAEAELAVKVLAEKAKLAKSDIVSRKQTNFVELRRHSFLLFPLVVDIL